MGSRKRATSNAQMTADDCTRNLTKSCVLRAKTTIRQIASRPTRHQGMPDLMLGKKVFRASALLSGSSILARILDAVAAIVIARFIAPADFGMVSIATATLLILRAATDLPVSEALIRLPQLEKAMVRTAFACSVGRGLIVAAGIAALAYPLAAIYDDPRLIGLMLALAIAPLAQGLQSPMLVVYAREVNYGPTAVMEVVAKLGAFAAGLLYAIMYQSYWALVIVMLAPPILTTIMSYLYAPWRPGVSLENVRYILGFAGSVTASRFLSTAGAGIDRFLVGAILGQQGVGFFALGRQIATTVSWGIGTPLMQALFPGFSQIAHDPERLKRAYLKGQATLVAGLLPVGVGLALVADPLVAVALGPEWGAVVPVIQIFAPVTTLTGMFTMAIHPLVLSRNQPHRLMIRDAWMFVVGVPVVVLGTMTFGLLGAVIARSFTATMQIFLNFKIVYDELKLGAFSQFRNCMRSLLAALGMTLGVLATKPFFPPVSAINPDIAEIVMTSTLGATLYVATHAVLWMMSGRPDGPEHIVSGMLAYLIPQKYRALDP